MAKFGSNEFTNFSIPLAFDGRYFILEPVSPPLLSVIVEEAGQPAFEVLKNRPAGTATSNAAVTPPGIVTVTNKTTGKFIYKVRPGSETSIAFGTLTGDELVVRITDRMVQIGTNTFQNKK